MAGIKAGKQELKPESQIPKVDAKWNEMFPEEAAEHCPLFKHSNDQYAKGAAGTLPGDICALGRCKNVTAERIIFASPGYDFDSKAYSGPMKAKFMTQSDLWNGVNIVNTTWDGFLESAVALYQKELKLSVEEYRLEHTPKDDWLVVTIDYHS